MTAPEILLADGLVPVTGWTGWVRPDAPERFAAHAAATAAAVAGAEPVRWVTWRHTNAAAVYALRRDRNVAALVRTLDHLVAGHVLAAAAVRAARPGDEVGCEPAPLPVYEVAALLDDLIAAPGLGVARGDLGAWLAERRAAFNRAVPPPAGPLGRVLRAWAAGLIASERAYPRAVTALYARDAVLDGLDAGSERTSDDPRC